MIFQKTNGSVLIIALLVLGVMVFLSSYFISFSLTGSQMSRNQVQADQAYYLAEAGVQEAIFKFKNDSTWKGAFETLPTVLDPACSSWSIDPFQRSGGIFDNGGYIITINNLGCAKAEIISQAFLTAGLNKKAQRIIRAKVFKAIGSQLGVDGIALFSAEGSGISLTNSAQVHITGGDIFSGWKIDAQNSSQLSSDNEISARDQINVRNSAKIAANASTSIKATDCSGDILPWPCNETPPQSIAMPSIDFDSSNPNSYKNRASYVYTENQFKNLISGSDNLIVPIGGGSGIIYVTGNITVVNSKKVTVNGLLVTDGNVVVKNSARLTVNNGDTDNPSGILSKGKISIENSAILNVGGLVYALDKIDFNNSGNITLLGGIMSGVGLSFGNSAIVNIVYSRLLVDTILSAGGDSPVIKFDYWEEEY